MGMKSRNIQGPTQHKHNGWKIRTNDQFRLCTTIIQVCKLGWAGHVVRMHVNKIVKKIFLGDPDGRRRAGKAQLGWFGCTENDLEVKGIKRWRKKAEDKPLWAVILKEALVKL